MTRHSDHDLWFEKQIASKLRDEFESELEGCQDNDDRVSVILEGVRQRLDERAVERDRRHTEQLTASTRGTSSRTSSRTSSQGHSAKNRSRQTFVVLGGVLSLTTVAALLATLVLPTSLRPVAWQPPPSLQAQVAPSTANSSTANSSTANSSTAASSNTNHEIQPAKAADLLDEEQGLQLVEASISSAFAIYENPRSTWRQPLREFLAGSSGEALYAAPATPPPSPAPANSPSGSQPHLIADLAANLLGRPATFD